MLHFRNFDKLAAIGSEHLHSHLALLLLQHSPEASAGASALL